MPESRAAAPNRMQTAMNLRTSEGSQCRRAAQRRQQEGWRRGNGAHGKWRDKPALGAQKPEYNNGRKQSQRGAPLELVLGQQLVAHRDIRILMWRIQAGFWVVQADVEQVKAAWAFSAVKAQVQMRAAHTPDEQCDAEERQQPDLKAGIPEHGH